MISVRSVLVHSAGVSSIGRVLSIKETSASIGGLSQRRPFRACSENAASEEITGGAALQGCAAATMQA
jgi:hypothetical protein